MTESPGIVSRIVTGPVLILAGLAIYGGLLVLALMRPDDWFHAVGVILGAEAYAIVGGLFVLLGMQYVLGPRSWIERRITGSLRRLLGVSALMGAVILACVLILVW